MSSISCSCVISRWERNCFLNMAPLTGKREAERKCEVEKCDLEVMKTGDSSSPE